MNPLDIPKWGENTKPKEPPKPGYLGIKNEIARAAEKAEKTITIEVRGVRGVPSGSYKIEFQAGQKLKRYFLALKLLKSATYAAVYDQSNPGHGRCRMTYIPQPGAVIVIGPPGAGTATHLQRTNQDAQKLARDMGGRGAQHNIVEVKKCK